MVLPDWWVTNWGNKPYAIADCLDAMKGIPENVVDLVVTSPPYNVGKDYGAYSDERPWGEYYDFIKSVVSELYRILRLGGTLAFNVPLRVNWFGEHAHNETWNDYDPSFEYHLDGEKRTGKGRIEPIGFRMFNIIEGTKFRMREPIIWIKGKGEDSIISGNGKMGCDSNPYLRGCCEIILLASKERFHHDGGTGRRGKDAVPDTVITKDVWYIPPTHNQNHSAPYPQEIVTNLIKLFIHRTNTQKLPTPIVFDPFLGSGTTLLACRSMSVLGLGFEITPEYEPVIKKVCMAETPNIEGFGEQMSV